MNEFYKVISPYFICAFETKNNTIIRAAPMIHYTLGWTVEETMGYFRQRKFKVKKFKAEKFKVEKFKAGEIVKKINEHKK